MIEWLFCLCFFLFSTIVNWPSLRASPRLLGGDGITAVTASVHYGSKQGDFETLNYTLSHERGSERSERASERVSAAEGASEASSPEQANE